MILNVVARFVKCYRCNGTGRHDDSSECLVCGGAGRFRPAIIMSLVHCLVLTQNCSLDGRLRKVHLSIAVGNREPICGQKLTNMPRNRMTWNGDVALVTCGRCVKKADVLRDMRHIASVTTRRLDFGG